jgi:hypothetical protein
MTATVLVNQGNPGASPLMGAVEIVGRKGLRFRVDGGIDPRSTPRRRSIA